MHIKLYTATISPFRPKVRFDGGWTKAVPKGAQYAVKVGLDVHFCQTIHEAIVYLGVATDFTGDVLRLNRSKVGTGLAKFIGDVPAPKQAAQRAILASNWLDIINTHFQSWGRP